jgi:Tol biopolymer transport system component
VQPYVLPDGSELYFSSSKGGDFDIYRSVRGVSEFGTPTPVSELNVAGASDGDPLVAVDDLTIYFSSSRAGGLGLMDIWMARRTDKALPFGAPVNLTEVNSTGVDAPTWLSPDGCRLYLSSDRGDAGYDIYVATRLP